MMVDNLISSGVNYGLPKNQASRLAIQTCLGAGKMMTSSVDDPRQLRRNVTSPNGTTHAATESMTTSGFEEMIHQAVKAAIIRSKELGDAMACG